MAICLYPTCDGITAVHFYWFSEVREYSIAKTIYDGANCDILTYCVKYVEQCVCVRLFVQKQISD